LSRFPLLVPPIAEQRAAARQLEQEKAEARSLKDKLAQKLDLLDQLRAALLRQAFSGKV